MAQLNLLPDVKLEFVKAQRRKRTVMAVSAVVSAALLAIFIALLIFVRFAQKQHMSALDKDIESSLQTLKSNPELDKILTVQNQLASLPGMHNEKTISSRLFDYLTQLTPTKATISEVKLDFDANTLSIKGNADALSTVNKFADTLKFTKYQVSGENAEEGEAFTNVVLKTFSVSGSEGGNISYELETKFNVAIFANSSPSTSGVSPVKLNVPNIISTRSATQTPGNELFVPLNGQGN
jgi:Tfp pilus assembly protein PilN